jgi:hypothetical protein
MIISHNFSDFLFRLNYVIYKINNAKTTINNLFNILIARFKLMGE